jgi:membrane protein
MANWKSTIQKVIKRIQNNELVQRFQDNNVPLLAASQAYYYLLAIFPLLIVCFAIVPYFNINTEEAIQFIHNVLPSELASVFEDNIISFIETPRGGLLTIGIIGALWSASGGVNAFIRASNEAYDVEETRNTIIVRLLSLGLTLGIILAVVTAIFLPIVLNILINLIDDLLGITTEMTLILQIIRWTVSVVVLTTFLMVLYKFAPNKKFPFKHVLPGALIAGVSWQLITIGFSLYVANFSNYTATYGSLGGVIILMIWFFLTGIILMVGALINVTYHQKQIREDPKLHKAADI